MRFWKNILTISRPSCSGFMTSGLIGGGLMAGGLLASGLLDSGLMGQWPYDPVAFWVGGLMYRWPFGLVAFWGGGLLAVAFWAIPKLSRHAHAYAEYQNRCRHGSDCTVFPKKWKTRSGGHVFW